MAIDIVFLILLFLGIFITAVPTLPGMAYMFFVVLIYGVVDKFETMQPEHLLIFGGFVLASMIIDYASGLIGAKFGGANKKSLLTGIIGLLVGLVVFPPFGLFIGLFLGVCIGEIIQGKHRNALKAASYAFLGTLTGMLLSVVLALAFFITFVFIIF